MLKKNPRYLSKDYYGKLKGARISEGDVLLVKDGATIGKTAVAYGDFPKKSAVNEHVFILRPNPVTNPRFLFYIIQSRMGQEQIKLEIRGAAQPGLNSSFVNKVFVPRILYREQTEIAHFLDAKTRLIDRFIRNKGRLIKLLQEQKQAVINDCVTGKMEVRRIVDENGNSSFRLQPSSCKMRDSGIDWLGEIPEHWAIRKIGHIAEVSNGSTPSRFQTKYWSEGSIPWLSSGKVNDYIVRTPSEFITEQAYEECSVSLIPRGTVIMGMIGQGKTRGMSAFLDIEACINQNLAAIIPKTGLDGRFLHHMLTAFYQPIRESGRGSNQEALNCDIISSIRLPFPCLDEQKAISKDLDHRLGKTARIIQEQQRQIDLIQEYRTRLIADVVTGKVDVRGIPVEDVAED